AAGTQGGSLEKSSVGDQAAPADPVAEKALTSAKASLENQTSVAGIAPSGGSGPTWVNRNPASPPMARKDHAVAYDSQNGKVILFGGWNGSAIIVDTRAYDFASNTWINRSSWSEPPARYNNAMAYDSQNGKVILFGGSGSEGDLNDTWAYDYAADTWTNRNPVSSPPARSNHAMAYDSQNGKVILFGGVSSKFLYDTWAYDYAANTWTNRSPASSPPARFSHAMAYDSQNGKVILFGGDGSSFLNDTWAYDYAANTWTNRSPVSSPPARYSHAMAYDSQNGKVILFGGDDSSFVRLNDTWTYEYASNAWTNRSPISSPLARFSHAMAYDSQNGKVILYGGSGSGGDLDDTWAFTLPPDDVTLEYGLFSGWNMISVPLALANPSPEAVFPAGWPLYSWNAVANTYLGRSQITLAIGKGYWLKAPTAYNLSITGQPNMESSFTISLSQGWNLIGTPYEAAIGWSTVRVHKALVLKDLNDAISAGWIKSPFYRWTGSTYAGLVSGGAFQPKAGYWVKVLVPGCTLTFIR
ncbi:MAG: hypothetical protein NTV33_08050, partial [Coprothermobacterota bacterium]|nr:hypothetical protein [Coprothermobacterota bacterium]